MSLLYGMRKYKLAMVIAFLGVTQLVMTSAVAQNLLSLKMSDVTLEEVVDKVEQETDYVFLYQEDIIDSNLKKSFNVENGRLEDVLDVMFEGSNVRYTIKNKQIILTKKSDAQDDSPERTVRGVVVDSKGETMIGVTVVVKGNITVGTVTDFDGRFNLAIKDKSPVLVISFIGMKKC